MENAFLSNHVSVIIPCYNQAEFLGNAVESVMAQTCAGFDVIVVDDGSTDRSADVARRYSGVRCLSQTNQGAGAARNTGLKHVLGEFVVFLDADDRLLPHAFEAGLRCFAAHPECALVAGRCVKISRDGARQPTRHNPVVERDHYLRLLTDNYIWTPATVMLRSAVIRGIGGFKTQVWGAEDYDLHLRIARNHQIWCHDQVVAEYRQHETNISRRSMLMMRSTITVMRGQRAFVRGDLRARRAWREGVRHWQDIYGEPAINVARGHFRAREWRATMADLARLFRYYPTGVVRHSCRKLSRIALGHKPETLAPPPDASRSESCGN
jgi:glycosyltransferase involved in cell wall biosynthesis